MPDNRAFTITDAQIEGLRALGAAAGDVGP